MKKYQIDGFSRFRFDINGDCFNAITGVRRKREQWSSGREFYRLQDDKNAREVVYVTDAEKAKEDEKNKSKEAGFDNATPLPSAVKKVAAPTPEKKEREGALSEKDVLDIHRKHAEGTTAKELAFEYGRKHGAMRNILLGIRYPKYRAKYLESVKA